MMMILYLLPPTIHRLRKTEGPLFSLGGPGVVGTDLNELLHEAGREIGRPTKPEFGAFLPTVKRKQVRKIGQMTLLEKEMVFPNPLPICKTFDRDGGGRGP